MVECLTGIMATREQLVDRGRKLEYFTIGWNSLEAIVACDSLDSLISGEGPRKKPSGIIIAGVALIAMPLLLRAKRKISVAIGSAAMAVIAADARQTDFCHTFQRFCSRVCC